MAANERLKPYRPILHRAGVDPRYGPLHAGGGSVLLLAYAPEETRERLCQQPLQRFTATTVTDPDDLRERLDTIRVNGYHIAINDLDEGAFSIAAPIQSASGEIIAALSVAGAMARYDEARRRKYLHLVQTAAAQISSKLGISVAA